jgi:hypothetical protein
MECVSHDLAYARTYQGGQPRGAASLRQQLLAWLSAFVETSDEFERFPALGKSAHRVRARLKSHWPSETHTIPLYPHSNALASGNKVTAETLLRPSPSLSRSVYQRCPPRLRSGSGTLDGLSGNYTAKVRIWRAPVSRSHIGRVPGSRCRDRRSWASRSGRHGSGASAVRNGPTARMDALGRRGCMARAHRAAGGTSACRQWRRAAFAPRPRRRPHHARRPAHVGVGPPAAAGGRGAVHRAAGGRSG